MRRTEDGDAIADYDWDDNVLNGIAYLKDRDTFFVTGKRWDFIFEIGLNYAEHL